MNSFYLQRDLNFITYRDWYFKQHNTGSSNASFNLPLDGSSEAFGGSPESDRDAASPLNIPTYMVNMAVSMVCQETPRIEVLVDESKKQQRTRGSIAEKVFNGVLYINSELQQKDLYHSAAQNMFTYGWATTYTIWDDTRVPERMKSSIHRKMAQALRDAGSPDARRFPAPLDDDDERAMPIAIECTPPWDLYPIPGGHFERWKGMLRRWRMTLEEAEDYFGVSFSRTTAATDVERIMEDRTTITCWDYWVWVGNRIWHAIFSPDLPEYATEPEQHTGIKPLLHRRRFAWVYEPEAMPEYHKLPYEVAFCYPTDDPRGEYFGLSLLYTVLDPVREAEALITRMNLIVDQFADPLIKRKFDTLKNRGAQAPAMSRGPGMTVDVNVGMGQDVEYLQLQGTPPGVKEMLDLWLQMAKEWGFDPTIDGTTGLDTIVKKSGILAKLTIPIRQLERLWSATHGRVCHLMVKMVKEESLSVRGQYTMNGAAHAFALDVKGTDLKGMQYCTFTIRARFPYEELQNAAAASTAVNANIMSRGRAMGSFMMVDDPDQELEAIQDEAVALSPAWNTKLVDIALMKLQALSMPQPDPTQAMPAPTGQPQLPPPAPGPEGASMGPMMPQIDMPSSLQQGGMDAGSYATAGDMNNPSTGLDLGRMLGQQLPGRPPTPGV